jgi:4a-hydroxytetrahydrobiopterin dehydratase
MELNKKKCIPCEGNVPPLTLPQARDLMEHVPGWSMSPSGDSLNREYSFRNFKKTMAFVNKVADLAEAEGHHPDMHVSYDALGIELTTHAIGGLSENDFILAAKINDLEVQ